MENDNYFQEERDKIIKGLEEAYKKLIEFKKQKNTPLVVSRNGEIMEVNPNKAFPTISYKRESKT